MDGDATKLDKALGDIDSNLKKTSSSLKDVNKLLKIDPSNMTLLGQKQKYIQTEINETKERLKILKQADKEAKKQLNEGKISTEQYAGLKRELIDTKQHLKELKNEVGGSSDVLANASINTEKFGKSTENLGKKMLPVTGAVVGVGAASVNTANQFEDSMAQASGALGLPMDKMEEMRQLAIEVGQETIFSAQEAGNAITELAKGGLTEADIKGGALKATMDMAASSGMSLGDSANTVVQAMGAFGLSADQSVEAANALAGAAAASSTDVAPLTQGLAQASAQANNAGWSIQETTAVLGRFADAGIVGSDAGTSLKTMLQRLAAPTDDAAELMEELGITTRDSSGHLLGAQDMAEELQTKLGGLSEAQRDAALQTIFGSDASRAASIMMRSGKEGLDKYVKATNDQEAAQRLANSQMGEGSMVMEQLRGSLETAGTQIGTVIAPVVQRVAEFITELVNKFSELPQGVQQVIVVFGGLLAAIGPLLIVVGKVALGVSSVTTAMSKMQGVGELVGTVVTKMKTMLTAFFGFLQAHPVIAIITAIIGIVILLYNKCEWFRDGVHAIIEKVNSFFQNFGNKATEIFNKAKDTILRFVENVKNFFLNMKANVSATFDNIRNFISNTVDNIRSKGVNAFNSLVNGIRSAVSRVTSVVRSGFQGAISFITSLPRQALRWGQDFIQGLINGIKSMISKVVGAVRNVANKIKSFLHFSRPDEGPLHEYETWMPDFMDGLAKGINNNIPMIEKAVGAVAETMNRSMSVKPQFAVAGNGSTSIHNDVTVMIGNEQFKGYITKTATKGISDMQRRNSYAKGGR